VPRASAVLILNDPVAGYPFACLESSLLEDAAARRPHAGRPATSRVLAIVRRHMPATAALLGPRLDEEYERWRTAGPGRPGGNAEADGFAGHLAADVVPADPGLAAIADVVGFERWRLWLGLDLESERGDAQFPPGEFRPRPWPPGPGPAGLTPRRSRWHPVRFRLDARPGDETGRNGRLSARPGRTGTGRVARTRRSAGAVPCTPCARG